MDAKDGGKKKTKKEKKVDLDNLKRELEMVRNTYDIRVARTRDSYDKIAPPSPLPFYRAAWNTVAV